MARQAIYYRGAGHASHCGHLLFVLQCILVFQCLPGRLFFSSRPFIRCEAMLEKPTQQFLALQTHNLVPSVTFILQLQCGNRPKMRFVRYFCLGGPIHTSSKHLNCIFERSFQEYPQLTIFGVLKYAPKYGQICQMCIIGCVFGRSGWHVQCFES